jgi:hypothetical protein
MISGESFLKVPKIEEREELILKHHDLGHFAACSTFERIRPNFYWHKMASFFLNKLFFHETYFFSRQLFKSLILILTEAIQ